MYSLGMNVELDGPTQSCRNPASQSENECLKRVWFVATVNTYGQRTQQPQLSHKLLSSEFAGNIHLLPQQQHKNCCSKICAMASKVLGFSIGQQTCDGRNFSPSFSMASEQSMKRASHCFCDS